MKFNFTKKRSVCEKTLTVFVVFLSLLVGQYVEALSAGASYKTCEHMTPIHGTFKQQKRDSVFSVNVSATEYGPGELINVTIQSECGGTFNGFQLQARRADTNSSFPIGSFSTPPGSHSVDKCGTSGQAVTQTDSSSKSIMRFEWTAPEESAGDIVMTVTFVQDFAIFWTKVRSAVIIDRNVTEMTTDIGMPLFPSPWACPRQIPSLNKTCGNLETCLNQCVDDECHTFVSWTKAEQSPQIQFTIESVVGRGGNRWIALGFSQDRVMGDDTVIECVSFEGRMTIYSSYNQADVKGNGRLDSESDLQTTYNFSASLDDGIFQCSFGIPLAGPVDFAHSWYLLLAWGYTHAEGDHKQKHVDPPFVSEKKIRFLGINSRPTITTTDNGYRVVGINTIWYVCLFVLTSVMT